MTYRYDACPHCAVSLLGDPIPEAEQKWFGGKTHLRREVAVTIQALYDGALFFRCPDCGATWHRWHADTRQHALAKPYVTVVEPKR